MFLFPFIKWLIYGTEYCWISSLNLCIHPHLRGWLCFTHLAASPPGRKFDTRGFPSLSVPPEMVRPSVLPSFFTSSTIVTPRRASNQTHTHTHKNDTHTIQAEGRTYQYTHRDVYTDICSHTQTYKIQERNKWLVSVHSFQFLD